MSNLGKRRRLRRWARYIRKITAQDEHGTDVVWSFKGRTRASDIWQRAGRHARRIW